METTPESATRPLPPAGGYRIDPAASEVSFTTRHLFGLAPVHGSFPVRGGSIEVGGSRTSVVAEIDATGFHTGNSARDGVVRSGMYLDADHHPVITFTAEGLVPADGGRWQLDGTLAVRGTSAAVCPVVGEVTVHQRGFAAVARARVDRRAFGITAQPGLTGRYLDLTVRVGAVAR